MLRITSSSPIYVVNYINIYQCSRSGYLYISELRQGVLYERHINSRLMTCGT